MAGVSTAVNIFKSTVPQVSVFGSPFSTSCPLNGGFSCNASITINFVITGNTRIPTDVNFPSGIPNRTSYTANADGGSITAYFQETDTVSRGGTNKLRVTFGTGGDYIESNNFTINHQGTVGFIAPTVNWTGPDTGSCQYSSPSTTCTATTSSGYNVSNYVDGTVTAEYVSGDTGITPVKSGSNSSGTFSWSKSISSPVSAVYRLKLAATSGTYYSANRTINLSSSQYVNPIGSGLKLWFDFPTSSNYINAVNNSQMLLGVSGQQDTGSPVSSALGSHHRETFSQSAGVNTVKNFNWETNPITILGDCSVAFWSNGSFGAYSGSYPNGYLILNLDPFEVVYDGYNYRLYSNGSLMSIISSGSSWEFIAFTIKRSGSTIDVRAYRNGVLVDTDLGMSSSVATGKLYSGLGTYNVIAQSSVATKEVDSLGLWEKELTAAEVLSLYNSGSGVTYSFFS